MKVLGQRKLREQNRGNPPGSAPADARRRLLPLDEVGRKGEVPDHRAGGPSINR